LIQIESTQMKEVKIILFIFCIILIVCNYSICDYFYYNEEIKNIKNWWKLKSIIYGIIMMTLFYASLINTKGLLKFVLSIGLGFCISNVIDKVFFNVLEFKYNDIIMIILTFCFAALDYLKYRKK